jgi:hypothetical protein
MIENKLNRSLKLIALAIVFAVVGWGFLIVGSPSFVRKVRGDQMRIHDLSENRDSIKYFFRDRGRFPETLSEVAKTAAWYGSRVRLIDSETKKPYVYKVTGIHSFELCAEFELSSKEAKLEENQYRSNRGNWEYKSGNNCFPVELSEKERSGE